MVYVNQVKYVRGVLKRMAILSIDV